MAAGPWTFIQFADRDDGGARRLPPVLRLENVSKIYPTGEVLRAVTWEVKPGDRIGLVGVNGAGKSTLFKMLTENEALDGGSLKVGETVKLGYVDQSRDSLNDDHTVWEAISDGLDELELVGGSGDRT